MEYLLEEFSSQEKIRLGIANNYFVKGDKARGRIVLSLNEIGEKSRAIIILGNCVSNP